MSSSQLENRSRNPGEATAEQDLSLGEVMGSVLAAGLGVQSRENKERDFTRGKPVHFIIAGVVFTGAFMAALITIVNLVT